MARHSECLTKHSVLVMWTISEMKNTTTTNLFFFCQSSVKTRILIFLDLGGKGGNSSPVTTSHVTASYKWFENKPKILLWQSVAKDQ